MKRAKLNALFDLLAFVAFAFLTTSGILIRYILPPGSGRFQSIYGLSRHDWGTIHFWLAVIFFAILASHLFLHWRWVVNLVKGRAREGTRLRPALAILSVLALLALAAAPLVAPIETDSTDSTGGQHQYRGLAR